MQNDQILALSGAALIASLAAGLAGLWLGRSGVARLWVFARSQPLAAQAAYSTLPAWRRGLLNWRGRLGLALWIILAGLVLGWVGLVLGAAVAWVVAAVARARAVRRAYIDADEGDLDLTRLSGGALYEFGAYVAAFLAALAAQLWLG